VIPEILAGCQKEDRSDIGSGFLVGCVLVVDEVGCLSYGDDAANVLFHVLNDRHLRRRPIIFTTNKSPITQWGDALHDPDLAEAIVDRTLERGQLLILDGPSYQTRHLPDLALDTSQKPARISGTDRPEFPERAPAKLNHVLAARRLVWKPLLKLSKGGRKLSPKLVRSHSGTSIYARITPLPERRRDAGLGIF